LNDQYPGISFDESGTCIHCLAREKKPTLDLVARRNQERRFLDLIDKSGGRACYDGLVAYSGGKDSTFLLDLLVNTYKLRVLAFTFDNWFQSPRSYQNIRAVTKALNIDHLTVRPRFESFKRIIRASVAGDFLPEKALQRSSAICTVCMSLIRHTGLRMAIEMKIPFIIFGLSLGQAPARTAVFKTSAHITQKLQSIVLAPLLERVGEAVRPYFLNESHFSREEDFPHSINPLAFFPYREEEILRRAMRLGWKKPLDTDSSSTNCLLNSLANEIHQERFGINPYSHEVAELVRAGVITRQEGLSRLARRPNAALISKLKAELEIELGPGKPDWRRGQRSRSSVRNQSA
jgi:tRNA(Ile)-lysidine synthase TilS/MesJ